MWLSLWPRGLVNLFPEVGAEDCGRSVIDWDMPVMRTRTNRELKSLSAGHCDLKQEHEPASFGAGRFMQIMQIYVKWVCWLG